MKKRFITLVTALALILGMAVTASAGFMDIYDSETAVAAAALESMGIVTGTATSIYSPNNTLTRAEFATLAVRAMGLEDKVTGSAAKTLFSDVTPGKWFTGYVNLAYTEGIINGYGNGRFGPDDSVTYGQVATILLRILGYTETEIGRVWPGDYVNYANDLGLPGSLKLSANASVNRGQAAILLYNTLKEPKNGSPSAYYETMNGVVSVDNAIVLDNNATSGGVGGYLMVCSVGELDAAVKYYKQKNTVSDTLVGNIGKLLLDGAGRVVGFLPDGEGYKNVTVSSATLSGITAKNGETIRITGGASVISGGSVYRYNTTGYLEVDKQSGKSVRLYYDDNGAVSHIYITAGTASGDTLAAVAETFTSANELARVLGISGNNYDVVKNGVPAGKSDLTQYDVAYYDAATNTMYASDYKISGVIAAASPSVGAAQTITVGGVALDVLECAWDSLKTFKLGSNVTLLLTDDNKVAAAYSTSTVRAPMLGVLSADGSSVTLCGSGVTFSGVVNASKLNYGALVRVSISSATVTCSALSRTTISGSVNVKAMTVGGLTLAPGAEIYENAADNTAVYSLRGELGTPSSDMTDIYWTGTLPASSVVYHHTNELGQIDVLLLRDVTGSSYDYGKITTYTGKSGVNLGGALGDAYNDAAAVTNAANPTGSAKYIHPLVTVTDGYGGLATGYHDSGNMAVKKASALNSASVTRGSFHQSGDDWLVAASSYEIPVGFNVQVFIRSTSSWQSGEAALMTALNSDMPLTVYYDRTLTTGAQVRIIVVG